MWIGDILQDILVELLNGNWLSIIAFTSYNCFSLFMAVLRGLLFLFPSPRQTPCQALPLLAASRCCLWASREEGASLGTGAPPKPKEESTGDVPMLPIFPGRSSRPRQHLPTSAWDSLGQGPFTWLCYQRGIGSLQQTQGPRMELELLCNSELCDVMGADTWYFMFRFFIWSQGLGGAFSSFPFCKTLFFCSHCRQQQATPNHQTLGVPASV